MFIINGITYNGNPKNLIKTTVQNFFVFEFTIYNLRISPPFPYLEYVGLCEIVFEIHYIPTYIDFRDYITLYTPKKKM